jgi:two-component system nitrate/nitrite response regulator NarL
LYDPTEAVVVTGMTTIPAIVTNTTPTQAPPPQGLTDHPVHFSPRERQIVACITTGASNREIAARMGLRIQTVKNHLCRIYRKLGVPNRVQLAVFALGHGAGEAN